MFFHYHFIYFFFLLLFFYSGWFILVLASRKHALWIMYDSHFVTIYGTADEWMLGCQNAQELSQTLLSSEIWNALDVRVIWIGYNTSFSFYQCFRVWDVPNVSNDRSQSPLTINKNETRAFSDGESQICFFCKPFVFICFFYYEYTDQWSDQWSYWQSKRIRLERVVVRKMVYRVRNI